MHRARAVLGLAAVAAVCFLVAPAGAQSASFRVIHFASTMNAATTNTPAPSSSVSSVTIVVPRGVHDAIVRLDAPLTLSSPCYGPPHLTAHQSQPSTASMLMVVFVPERAPGADSVVLGQWPLPAGGATFASSIQGCSTVTLNRGSYRVIAAGLRTNGWIRLAGGVGASTVVTPRGTSRAMATVDAPAPLSGKTPAQHGWGSSGRLRAKGLLFTTVWESFTAETSMVLGDCEYDGPPPASAIAYQPICLDASYGGNSFGPAGVSPTPQVNTYASLGLNAEPGTFGLGGYVGGIATGGTMGAASFWVPYTG